MSSVADSSGPRGQTKNRLPTLRTRQIKEGKFVTSETQKIKALFTKLRKQPERQFPREREQLEAPLEPGVYVIRNKKKIVLHVGRTLNGKNGLYQRLKNHLHGSSSFTNKYLKGNGAKLRKGCTYQSLVVKNPRQRALLESYAVGMLCPKHIGLGERL